MVGLLSGKAEVREAEIMWCVRKKQASKIIPDDHPRSAFYIYMYIYIYILWRAHTFAEFFSSSLEYRKRRETQEWGTLRVIPETTYKNIWIPHSPFSLSRSTSAEIE